MANHFFIIAGEEAGPKSNKMGGIWNVIHGEATTLAALFDSGKLETKDETEILVAGPYYGYRGADWNRGLSRITSMEGFSPLNIDGELRRSLESLENSGIKAFTGEKYVGNKRIGYLQFQTSDFGKIRSKYIEKEMTLESRIKAEAYEHFGLDSLRYESASNGSEYTHYLSLSYAISELVRLLTSPVPGSAKTETEEPASTQEFSPCPGVSLHCHEFGVFYAAARLKKLGVPANTVATLHATLPGRTAGYNSIQKRRNNDSTWPPGVPENLAALEALALYADTITTVGESTRQEARLFYGVNGIVIRNGIVIDSDKIDWNRKERCLEQIRKFLSVNLYKYHGGERIEPGKIIPIFTISRIEVENKGYPELLDSLVDLDHIIKNSILEGFATGGMLVTAVGFIGFLFLPTNFIYLDFAAMLLLVGMGMGMFAAPNTTAIMNSVPPEHRGASSGMRATFQNTAQTLSITLIFTVVASGLASHLPTTLFQGLIHEDIPAAVAQRVANLPPTSALFAAFLGYNPMATLLPATIIRGLPAVIQTQILGKAFFPTLISGPFKTGLQLGFSISAALSIIAAIISFVGGKRTVPEVETAPEIHQPEVQ